jgi:hypothetical protein
VLGGTIPRNFSFHVQTNLPPPKKHHTLKSSTKQTTFGCICSSFSPNIITRILIYLFMTRAFILKGISFYFLYFYFYFYFCRGVWFWSGQTYACMIDLLSFHTFLFRLGFRSLSFLSAITQFLMRKRKPTLSAIAALCLSLSLSLNLILFCFLSN